MSAQPSTNDRFNRLRSALPEEGIDQIIGEIGAAAMRQLPTGALEHYALVLASKGMPAAEIAQAIAAHHRGLWLGRETLRAGGRPVPTEEEIEAAGAVLHKGMDDAAVSALVHSAPPDRSLAAPLFVVASLLDRGLPADDVAAAMLVWLESGASDVELYDLAGPPKRPELRLIRVVRHIQRPGDTEASRRRPNSHQ